MNPFSNTLPILAGARPDAIRRARNAASQAATTGLVMLITATIASLTMGYALHRSFSGDRFALPVAIGGGLLWGAFVVAVDRLLLLGIDKKARWYRTALQLLLRMPIAVVLGVAISKPVILRVSQTILDRNLRQEKRDAVDAERTEHEQQAGLSAKTTSAKQLREAVQHQQARVQREPDSFDYTTARDEVTHAERHHDAVQATNNRSIVIARNRIANLGRSDREEDARQIQRLRNSIAGWRTEIARASEAVDNARAHRDEIGQQWTATEKNKLKKLEKELETALAAEKEATNTANGRTGRSETELAELMRPNLVNEYTTLRRIQANPNNPDAKTLTHFEWALDLLFILFELTPLMAKTFSRISALDHATSAIEEEERERIEIETLAIIARVQKIVEVSHTVDDEALEQWAAAKLDEIQQNLPLTTQKLRSIRADMERMSA